jgi:hypothetical protein
MNASVISPPRAGGHRGEASAVGALADLLALIKNPDAYAAKVAELTGLHAALAGERSALDEARAANDAATAANAEAAAGAKLLAETNATRARQLDDFEGRLSVRAAELDKREAGLVQLAGELDERTALIEQREMVLARARAALAQ